MASSSGRALNSKQIHEQLHDDSDPFSEFSLDSNVDIFDRIDPDGVSGCSGGYKDEDHDNEDSDLWDENNHDFYMTPFCASSAYKPPRSRQMPVSPNKYFMLYFNTNLYEETSTETNRYVSKKAYTT
jgi:hypothetical protein